MRSWFFASLIICLGAINAQNITTFNKVFYYNGDSLQNDVMVMGIAKSDSCIYTATVGAYNNMWSGTQVFKIDKHGNPIDSIRFNNPTIAFPTYPGNCINIDNDKNLIIASNKYYLGNGVWEGYLIKLNEDLDTLWTRTVHLPDSLVGNCNSPNNYFTAIDVADNGDYVVLGNYYHGCIQNTLYRHAYLCRYNKNGDLLWIKTYPDLSSAFDINVIENSGFIFSAGRAGYLGVFLCKTDSIGNLIQYYQEVFGEALECFDVTSRANIIVGVVPFEYTGTSNPNLVKFGLNVTKVDTNTDSIKWRKQYIPLINIQGPLINQHIEVEIDARGNIFVGGTAYIINFTNTAGSYRGFLIKIDPEGNLIWCKYYDKGDFFNHDVQFNDFILTDDGGILAGGFWIPPYMNYKQGAWLVKTDSIGDAPGTWYVGYHDEINISPNKLEIYPNPANDYIDIIWQSLNGKDLELFIVDMTGRIIKTETVTAFNRNYRINTNELSDGLYTIGIRDGNTLLGTGKFLKR